MKLGRVLLLWILFLILSSTVVFAQVVGRWNSTENSCDCSVLIIIERGSDGSVSGRMNFPGAQRPIYRIAVDGDNISFLVDQPTNNAPDVTYEYDATVSGDNMTGTYTKLEPPRDDLPFSATRSTDAP